MYAKLMCPHSQDLLRRLDQFLSMPAMAGNHWAFDSLCAGKPVANVHVVADDFYERLAS